MSGSTQELKEDIDNARDSVRETLSEITNRLSPKRAASDVTEWIQEEMGPIMQTVGKALRKHSLPAAAAGAGIAWLVVALLRDDDEPRRLPDNGWSPDQLGATRAGGEPTRVTRTDMRPVDVTERADGTSQRLVDASNAVRASADALHRSLAQINSQMDDDEDGTWARLKLKATEALETAQAQIAAGTQKAKGYLVEAYDTSAQSLSQAYDYAGDKARQAGRAVAKSYDGSPLLYGLIGLAAGTALAMFLPPTRPEDRLMGPRRDQLVSAAEARWRAMRGQAEDVTIQGLQSATDTLRSASDSVVEQIKRAEASTRSSIADGAAVVEDLVAQKLDALREQQPV